MPSRLPSDLDEKERNTDRRLGLCMPLGTCTEQPFYKPLFFRTQELMIYWGGGMDGQGQREAKRRNNVGVQIMQKC